MIGYVYLSYCKKTGLYYVGAHSGNKFDENYYGSGVAIVKDIEKYGIENFEHYLLLESDSYDELAYFEYQMIEFFDTLWPKGYNKSLNTDSNHVHTPKQKEKIRQGTIKGMKTMNNRERLSPWLGKKNPQHAEWMRNAFKNHKIKNHNMQTYIKCSCGKDVMSVQMSRHLKAKHKLWFKHAV